MLFTQLYLEDPSGVSELTVEMNSSQNPSLHGSSLSDKFWRTTYVLHDVTFKPTLFTSVLIPISGVLGLIISPW